MREILFKAKRIDNGEWVEGNLVFLFQTKVHGAFIIPIKFGNAFIQLREGDLGFRYWYKVDKETLCQFTGLCDKSGNKIWENDIVNHNGEYAPVKFGRYCSCFDYGNYNFGFYVDFPEKTFYRKELGYWCRKVETAGNVFNNPELLQEESDE